MTITNSTTFGEALKKGQIDEAESWLKKVKDHRDLYLQYDDRIIDHREAELMHALFGRNLWARAKQLIEESTLESSKEPRRKRLVEVVGRPYDEI